jgi:hypothetical protein
VEIAASGSSLASFVGEHDDVCAGCLGVRQGQRRPVAGFPEQALSAREHEWIQHEPKAVDQAVPHEGVDQPAAAVDQQILAGLLLQLLHGLDGVAFEQPCVPLQRLFQGCRCNELGHAVDLFGIWITRPLGPRGNEFLVGDPAEEEPLAVEQQLGLEL